MRYKVSGDQQWKFPPSMPTTSTSVNLTGLTLGKTYVYQVITGCAQTPSLWSSQGSFVAQ